MLGPLRTLEPISAVANGLYECRRELQENQIDFWHRYFAKVCPLCGTDFCTPPVLGGAAIFDNSAPAVYKFQGPSGDRIFIECWRWIVKNDSTT